MWVSCPQGDSSSGFLQYSQSICYISNMQGMLYLAISYFIYSFLSQTYVTRVLSLVSVLMLPFQGFVKSQVDFNSVLTYIFHVVILLFN